MQNKIKIDVPLNTRWIIGRLIDMTKKGRQILEHLETIMYLTEDDWNGRR